MDPSSSRSECDVCGSTDGLHSLDTHRTQALYDLALDFMRNLESSATEDVCYCIWHEVTRPGADKPTKILGNTNPLCPVHSKEGVLLAFIEFLNSQPNWVVRYNPPTPDPAGTTLEVQSSVQGSTTQFEEARKTAMEWVKDHPEINTVRGGEEWSGIDPDATLITREEFASILRTSKVEYHTHKHCTYQGAIGGCDIETEHTHHDGKHLRSFMDYDGPQV